MKKFLLTLLLVVLFVPQAFGYTVKGSHPRVFFTDEAELKAKCNSALSAIYDPGKIWVDANLINDVYPLADVEAYVFQAECFGLFHIVEGATDTAYYHEAKLMMDYVWGVTDWHESEYYMRCLAILYDSMHAKLVSQSLDDNWGDSLAVAVDYFVNENRVWYTGNTSHNTLAHTWGLSTGGIALYGDGHGTPLIDGDDTAIAACDTFMRMAFGDPFVIAYIDSIAHDGGYFQGAYNRDGLYAFAEGLWIFENGTTDIAAMDSSSCFAGWADYITWDTSCEMNDSLPGDAFGTGKQGDSGSHAGGRGNDRHLVNLLTSSYQDPNGMWLEDQFAIHADYLSSRNEKWKYIAFHDTALAAISPVTAGWPIAKKYDVGTVFMRNGWDMEQTGNTDIWAVYRHEQYPFGHAQADVGHFCVFRGDDLLLIDSGTYDTSISIHHTEYFSQTIAHNTITIKKPGETFAEATENTGGQRFSSGGHPATLGAYSDSMQSANRNRGNITDFEVVGDTLVYIRSDLTGAYTGTKVDTVRREFVWLEPKDTFLIFDTVKTTGVGADTLQQKQLFHMIDNPTTTAATARWTNGTSQAKITSLFGTGDVTVTKVGGAGHRWDCNGTDYPPVDYPGEGVNYCSGQYRIELSPGQSDSLRWMLTAVQVTAEADTSYAALTLITNGDYIGAVVGVSDTLLFHKYGESYITSLEGGEESEPTEDGIYDGSPEKIRHIFMHH